MKHLLRALEKSLEPSDYTDILLKSYLSNRYLICVIRDFRTFSEISYFFLDKGGDFCYPSLLYN
jgi:hypothetical protein